MDNIKITFGTTNDIGIIAQFQVDMAMESEGTTLNKAQVTRGVTHAMEDDSKGKSVKTHEIYTKNCYGVLEQKFSTIRQKFISKN